MANPPVPAVPKPMQSASNSGIPETKKAMMHITVKTK